MHLNNGERTGYSGVTNLLKELHWNALWNWLIVDSYKIQDIYFPIPLFVHRGNDRLLGQDMGVLDELFEIYYIYASEIK